MKTPLPHVNPLSQNNQELITALSKVLDEGLYNEIYSGIGTYMEETEANTVATELISKLKGN